MEKTNNIFKNGSVWLKADFHLHTKADKEFKYDGEDNDFVKKYIGELKKNNVGIGIITNHNKFNLEEFKAIKKTAEKEDIFIMPGVELSVKDGANGIHILVVFNPHEWLKNENNFIQHFIGESFSGKANFENENSRSNHNLITTLEKLNKYQKSYFVIFRNHRHD